MNIQLLDVTITAAGLRFRAVLMTALSFILGIMPLVIFTGIASRQIIDITVVSGMMVATFFATLLIPAFYLLLIHRANSTR